MATELGISETEAARLAVAENLLARSMRLASAEAVYGVLRTLNPTILRSRLCWLRFRYVPRRPVRHEADSRRLMHVKSSDLGNRDGGDHRTVLLIRHGEVCEWSFSLP